MPHASVVSNTPIKIKEFEEIGHTGGHRHILYYMSMGKDRPQSELVLREAEEAQLSSVIVDLVTA